MDSKINTGFTGILYEIQLLSNSDAKVVEASGESTVEGITTKEYIKITLNDAINPTTASVIYQIVVREKVFSLCQLLMKAL